ncbi:MAG: ATP-binding cassette domain-containing protein, partial [Anaerolineaceae bacterium]|nr:ATP-binding cassette domain-containing protein [Anaerolineaceae bacterium]
MELFQQSSKTLSESSGFAIECRNMNVYYGNFMAVKQSSLQIERQKITAIIGPSGCGKSTVLRSFNRMNDFVPTCRVEGEILFHGENIYAPD